MATVTGDVVYDFSSEPNANPWELADPLVTPRPFVSRNGMTAIIDGFALKSNFNSAGYLSYVETRPDQSLMEVKGEASTDSTDFNATIGCGAVNSVGNGYILWNRGNIFRMYKVTAFVLSQLGDGFNIAYAALAQIGVRYEFSAGEVTLTLTINGVDQPDLIRTDSILPYNGDLDAAWFFNFDDANTKGFRSIAVDGIVSGPKIASINGGAGIVSGSAGNAMVVSGFASPVTDLTVGGMAMTAVTNTSGDNYTFTDPGFIDGEVDPGFGTLSAVASNVGEESSAFNVTRTLDADLTAVVMSTLSEDPETIALKAALQGLTISPGDTLYSALTIYDDGTISDADDGDHDVWHRNALTDVMTLIIVTIGAGAVISVGITMRALTGRNFTMKNLTMRSL